MRHRRCSSSDQHGSMHGSVSCMCLSRLDTTTFAYVRVAQIVSSRGAVSRGHAAGCRPVAVRAVRGVRAHTTQARSGKVWLWAVARRHEKIPILVLACEDEFAFGSRTHSTQSHGRKESHYCTAAVARSGRERYIRDTKLRAQRGVAVCVSSYVRVRAGEAPRPGTGYRRIRYTHVAITVYSMRIKHVSLASP